MKSYVFPGNIEDSILQIGGKPFPYMRTAQFSEFVKDSERMLLHLINCPEGRVIFYTASGTGAMDAVVANYVSQCEKAFILVGGSSDTVGRIFVIIITVRTKYLRFLLPVI